MTPSTIDTATGKAAPAEKSEERVQSIFTEIAEQYEKFNHYSSFGQDKRWLHKLVCEAPITPETKMLDIAGGTGEVSFAACKLNPPASIHLTDFTPAMLEVAREHIAAGKNQGVPITTQVVDAQDMPLDDASFDLVTMAYGIRNMPDRPAALSEIYRVLKPGGSVHILEFSTPPNALARAGYKFYLKHGIPAWGEHFTGKRDDFVYLADSIQAFPDQETFAEMLTRAGFSQVSYENLSFGAVAIHRAIK